jgi:hypothetical protein
LVDRRHAIALEATDDRAKPHVDASFRAFSSVVWAPTTRLRPVSFMTPFNCQMGPANFRLPDFFTEPVRFSAAARFLYLSAMGRREQGPLTLRRLF